MPDPRPLPPNPAPTRTLTDPEFRRVKADSEWPDPSRECLVCQKSEGNVFRARDPYPGGSTEPPTEFICDCTKQWILYHWFLNAGLKKAQQRFYYGQLVGPGDLVDQNLDALTEVTDYVDNIEAMSAAGLGLILWSKQPGTGKSILATLILKQAMAKGVNRCFFTTFAEMISFFTAGWKDEDAKEWFATRVKNAGLLVIDDIGREYRGNKELAEKTVDLLLRHRIYSGLPTIVTTNFSEEEIQEGYGGNIISLLRESSTYVEVTGDGGARTRANKRMVEDAKHGLSQPLTVGWVE